MVDGFYIYFLDGMDMGAKISFLCDVTGGARGRQGRKSLRLPFYCNSLQVWFHCFRTLTPAA
jgi:hypothetical protein